MIVFGNSLIRYLHSSQNTPCLPSSPPPPPPFPHTPQKICTTFVFNFSWVLQVVPREIDGNAYAKFGERTNCIMGDVQIANPQQSGGYLVRLFSADSPHKKLTTFGNLQTENTFISSLMKSTPLTLLTLSRIKCKILLGIII